VSSAAAFVCVPSSATYCASKAIINAFTESLAQEIAGTKVQVQGNDVGEITSSAVIPASNGDRAVALGYIRREVGIAGKDVQIAESSATVADLPFADLLTKQS